MKSCIVTLILPLCVIHGGYSTTSDIENNTPIKKLLMYTEQRCGSTLLDSLLASHHNVFSTEELFNNINLKGPLFEQRNEIFEQEIGFTYDKNIRRNPTSTLTRLWSERRGKNETASSRYQVIGVKIHHQHLDTSSLENIIQTFHGNDLKIIYMYRSDLLAQYTSLMIAKSSSEWHLQNTSGHTVTVQASRFHSHVCKELDYASFASILQRYNQTYFSVEYERDLNDYHRLPHVLANIQRYMGLNRTKLQSQMFKQTTVPLETQVTNWGDLPSGITDYHYKYRNLTGFLWDLCEKQRSGLCPKDIFMMNDSNKYFDMVSRFVKLDVSRE